VYIRPIIDTYKTAKMLCHVNGRGCNIQFLLFLIIVSILTANRGRLKSKPEVEFQYDGH